MSNKKICYIKDNFTGDIRVAVLEKHYRVTMDGTLIKEYLNDDDRVVFSTDPETFSNMTSSLFYEEDLDRYFEVTNRNSQLSYYEDQINRGLILTKILG